MSHAELVAATSFLRPIFIYDDSEDESEGARVTAAPEKRGQRAAKRRALSPLAVSSNVVELVESSSECEGENEPLSKRPALAAVSRRGADTHGLSAFSRASLAGSFAGAGKADIASTSTPTWTSSAGGAARSTSSSGAGAGAGAGTGMGGERVVLSAEQRYAVELAVRGQSFFFTGSAGSGKSTALRAIVSELAREGRTVSVTASTGAAALLIGGSTLHSWAGCGLASEPVAALRQKMNARTLERWRSTDCLIVDEISMVEPGLFEKLEELGRMVRMSDEPFGGLQVIACGDFGQLPPVKVSRGGGAIPDDASRFLFSSAVWREVMRETLLLTVVHRQREPELLDMLESVREGRLTPQALATIRATESNSLANAQGIEATKLFACNADVDTINASRLAQLPQPQFDQLAADSGLTWLLKKNCKLPEKISLRVGAQVMLLVNKPASGLVNGSRGVVVELPRGPGGPVGVQFIGLDAAFPVGLETLEVPGGPGGTPAARRQYPLRLAWATTIHKSQGCTLDLLECDLSGCFEVGQAYTALSRCSSLHGLRVVGFSPGAVRCSPAVAAFYRDLREQAEAQKAAAHR